MYDPTFKNEDNPYGKFILHRYTNMRNSTDLTFPANITGRYFLDYEVVEYKNEIPRYQVDLEKEYTIH